MFILLQRCHNINKADKLALISVLMPRVLILFNLQKYAHIFNLISSSTQFYPHPYLFDCLTPKCISSRDLMLLLPLIFHFVISTSPFGQVQSPQKLKDIYKKEIKPVFDAVAAAAAASADGTRK